MSNQKMLSSSENTETIPESRDLPELVDPEHLYSRYTELERLRSLAMEYQNLFKKVEDMEKHLQSIKDKITFLLKTEDIHFGDIDKDVEEFNNAIEEYDSFLNMMLNEAKEDAKKRIRDQLMATWTLQNGTMRSTFE